MALLAAASTFGGAFLWGWATGWDGQGAILVLPFVLIGWLALMVAAVFALLSLRRAPVRACLLLAAALALPAALMFLWR